MLTTPSEVGALAELAVATALTKAGFRVFVPFFGAHSRVDLVYARADGTIRRVQCKSACLQGDVLRFAVCSHTGNVEKPYTGEVDDFGVFCAALDTVYLVPIEHVPATYAHLRLHPTRNNQKRKIRLAADYVLGPP
jgi:hypothetical protein